MLLGGRSFLSFKGDDDGDNGGSDDVPSSMDSGTSESDSESELELSGPEVGGAVDADARGPGHEGPAPGQ